MANPLTAGGFPDVLDPRFDEVMDGVFSEVPDIVPELYTIKSPDQSTMRVSGLTPMGLITEFQGAYTYDGPDQGYAVAITNKEFGGGVMIERYLMEFDQFDVIEQQWKLLARSLTQTRQTYALRAFNSGFAVDTAFDYSNDEGVALFSDSHTTPRAGVSTASGFDNLGTAALSPTALKAARLQFRKLKDLAGQPIDGWEPDTLIVPVDLKDRAEEILKTTTGLDTAEGNVNVLSGAMSLWSHIRLSDTNNWFVVNKAAMKDSLRWYDKVKNESKRMKDFDTEIGKYTVYALFSCGRDSVWQWGVGNSVS